METKLTEQESLAIISEMIKQARNNFQKGAGNSLIFSGLLVSFTAILNIILLFILFKMDISPNHSFWIWCLMIPSSYIHHLIEKKVNREYLVKTHIDTIISSIWKGFGYSIWILLAVIFIVGFGKKFYNVFYLINPLILILVGLAEFITAKVCRFRPYLQGAIIIWLGALACIATIWIWEPVIIQFLILALCMILGFVIPGNKLNKLAKENV